MMKNKKALVLLNMGGPRRKEELKMFLTNMFNDKNIITVKSNLLRKMIAFFITTSRLNSAWENYEKIGGLSPINKITENLVEKLNDSFDDIYVTQAMRYTPPFAISAVEQIKQQGIKDVILLPLYPQYSTTTTKSSVEDFQEVAKNEFNIEVIDPFYKNDEFNEIIINELISKVDEVSDYNLIFSAHGLPQKIVNAGDVYEKHVNDHVKILSDKLKNKGYNFKSINLAYQSKVGPMKWLEPSLDDMLKNFKNQKVLIYPIAFIIDNSETDFELSIEYKEIADEIGVSDYKVCKCVNDSESFIKTVKELIGK
ncbi:ferrochelatase [Arcobacter sp. CECT 8985]|uniref:ferrochelatase n=1 Tax=Arcobacter sp. CECT 8985 TaxID=1935424 RepID=UPI00100AC93D|nr:ferrochelatase [Arcobacter sp. CECT 8985]RXJ86111.1 ferrochelatase [Arcobacter sp. CECT 8985]